MSYAGNKTVVIADVQDNPGAGATSDTTGLLKALVEGKATDAVLALLHDPQTVAAAQELGEGGIFLMLYLAENQDSLIWAPIMPSAGFWR